jgi:uncharacterized protein (TIGR02246 family)
MRRTILAVSLLACSLPCFAGGVQSVEAAWLKAIQANDAEALAKLYADDAVAWFPNEKEARGRAAILAEYQGLLGANTVTAASLSDTSHHTMGKASVGWGHFSLTLQPKAGGAPMVMAGRFTDVAELRGGHWRYVADHASAEPAAMPASK